MSTQHEDKIDLLPCPFCGCVDAHLTIRDDGLDAVMCDDCTAEGPAFNDRASAASGWNRRAVVSKAQEPAVKAGWIAVEDQMPPMDEEVLVYCPNFGDGRIELDTWGEIRECPVSFSTESVCVGEGWENNEFEQVSHWMRKPEDPGKETTHV